MSADMGHQSGPTPGARARLIAFYLPQFHPIPENDIWWGRGFTEWTNVTRAKPLYQGHRQPRLPGELGFYDLRVPEVGEQQAELAREHGVEGFCYWHYWFAGRRLLERPFLEVVRSGRPDFPFCLGWANQTWTGIWHGNPERVLIEQTYPGWEDYDAHFFALLPAFRDRRYLRVDGRVLFVVFLPDAIPNVREFTDRWRELAREGGVGDFWFVGLASSGWDFRAHGFDGTLPHAVGPLIQRFPVSLFDTAWRRLTGRTLRDAWGRIFSRPRVYRYRDVVRYGVTDAEWREHRYPCVIPNWDSTPRAGKHGIVFHGSTPDLYGCYLRQAIAAVQGRPPGQRLVFIKSWNEWAEGNYLEPDRLFGRAYLEVTRRETLVSFEPGPSSAMAPALCRGW